MSDTIPTITTRQALDILASLSPTAFREDQVIVDCQTEGESISVENAAKAALSKGYVKRVIQARKNHDMRIVIDFHKRELVS